MSKRKHDNDDTKEENSAPEKKHFKQEEEESQKESLLNACIVGDLQTVKDLIAQKVDLESFEHEGKTALFLACRYGHIEIVRELIACKHGYIDVVRELIKQKVDVDTIDITGARPFDHMLVPDITRELVNCLPFPRVVDYMRIYKHYEIARSILFERLARDHWNAFKWLLVAQKQPQSPLSMLYKDLLQDINIALKEKMFS